MGGTIDIETRAGEGTTFRLRLPLTMAVLPTVMVSCGGELFALPQASVSEVRSLQGRGLESVHGAPVFRLRGALLPVIHLANELALELGSGVREDLAAPVAKHGVGASVVARRRFIDDPVIRQERVSDFRPRLRGCCAPDANQERNRNCVSNRGDHFSV